MLKTSPPAHCAPTNQPSDSTLVHRVQTGDHDAYALLWERHKDAVRKTLYARLRSQRPGCANIDNVDDLASDVSRRVLQSIRDGFEVKGNSLAQYFKKAARNTVDHFLERCETRLVDTVGLEEDSESPGSRGFALVAYRNAVDMRDTPCQVLVRREESRRLRLAFEALPVYSQCILMLSEVDRFSQAEIAELLGLTLRQVRAGSRRAREMLRHRYGDGALPGYPPTNTPNHTRRVARIRRGSSFRGFRDCAIAFAA
jgi:RNA polymerase sigma factor (sigma-70 family)